MSLSDFLSSNKQHYLTAVRDGTAQDWVVVMGNEAGDLDSIASSLAYSWFATIVKKSPTVALIQTPREDLKLRPENILAFSLASITPDQKELLCIDDVPASVPFPSNKFALVDHNRLLSRFASGSGDVKVVAVLDHHEDEGLYKDTADPRIIVVPSGSATSLVATYIRSAIGESETQIPSEVATLLLCGILVDTNGLKASGKAEQVDRDAAAFLRPLSSLASTSVTALGPTGADLYDAGPLQALAHELLEKKSDVSHLSSTDLLRRDYKQYEWTTSWTPDKRAIHVGLSTVPVDLKTWIPRSVAEFWESADKFMDSRGLDILGVLTSFSEEKQHGKGHKKGSKKERHTDDETEEKEKAKKGKHKRQVLFIVRESPGGSVEERLWEGLERSKELEVERRPLGKYAGDLAEDGGVGERKARAYKQGNVKATRKVIAPLVKNIIEGKEEK